MTTFKAGDRVAIIGGIHQGDKGTVAHYSEEVPGPWVIPVKLDSFPETQWWRIGVMQLEHEEAPRVP